MQVYLRLEKPAVPCVVDTGKERKKGGVSTLMQVAWAGSSVEVTGEKIQKVRQYEPLQPNMAFPSHLPVQVLTGVSPLG